MTAAKAAQPLASKSATAVTLCSPLHLHSALLKHRCCSVVGSPVIRSSHNDYEKPENIYSDEKDTITKKKK